MKYLTLLSLCIILVTPKLFAQDEAYQAIKKLPITESEKITKIDSLLNQYAYDMDFTKLEIVSRRYSVWLSRRTHFEKALDAIKISIKNNTADSLGLQQKLYFAGYYASQCRDYRQSTDLFDQAISINNNSKLGIAAYNSQGLNYYFLGDLHLSKQYFETAELLTIQQGNIAEQCRGYINSFNTYRDLNTTESRDRLFKNLSTADSLIAVTPLFWKTKSIIKRCLGKYYYMNKKSIDTINGLNAFQEALDFAVQASDSITIAGLYGEMGVLFNFNNLDKSIKYLEKAIQFYPSTDLTDLEVIYSNLGRNQAKKGKFEPALANLNKALELVLKPTEDFDNLTVAERRKLWEAHSTDDYLWDISSFIAETYLLQYEKTKNDESLRKSIEYFKITDEIFDYFTGSVNELNSKLQWRKLATQHYGRALKACFYANDTENALYFMEKNKALILSEKIEQQRTNRSFGLPKEVYLKERLLEDEILRLEELAGIQKDPTETWQSVLKTKRQLATYWDSIQKVHLTKIPNRKITLLTKKEIQNSMDLNEILVEFHLTVDDETGIYENSANGYVLVLEKDAAHLAEIPTIKELKEDILTLSKNLKTPFSTKENFNDFNQLSHQLYLRLFPTEEIRNSLKGRIVTIVPDNYLSLIPFEALTTNTTNMQYLLQDCEIHYLYSKSFLENNKKDDPIQNSFLGMAPTNFSELDLPQLNYSALEIESLQKYYSGSSLFNEKATKDSFLDQLPNHGIIHLATHADAQDSTSPWIAFYDGKITLEELYQTQNNASLVVLSGCNTTLGEQAVGEGVMSLARGFFYSGAQSVMSTLWSIDDKSTATITKSFYENLEDGQTKSAALHNAKLNYLNTHSLSEASPYYWASFIMLGDNGTLESDFKVWPFLLGGILLLGITVFILYRRKSLSGQKQDS